MKKFDRSINGYNVHQVNAFVDDVVVKVDEMINNMKQKDMKIDHLTNELEHYKKMDATLNRAVVLAEEAASRIAETSLSESDLIVTEAKKNANRIINDALMKAEHYESEAARLRRNIITFKRRVKNLIDQQADIVEDLDKIDIE